MLSSHLPAKFALAVQIQVANLKARFHYERGKKHSLFVLLIFFALASILTARFNRRSIKERKRKNALFHARSGNGPLSGRLLYCKVGFHQNYENRFTVQAILTRLLPSHRDNFKRHWINLLHFPVSHITLHQFERFASFFFCLY